MIPKQQELRFEYERIFDAFDKFVKEGWVIHQMIPSGNGGGGVYFILHKY